MASPSVAAGSGGEGSSGSGSGGAEPPGRHLPALFEQAAERLPGLLGAASKEQLLYLYARYKQVRPGRAAGEARARREMAARRGLAGGGGRGAAAVGSSPPGPRLHQVGAGKAAGRLPGQGPPGLGPLTLALRLLPAARGAAARSCSPP